MSSAADHMHDEEHIHLPAPNFWPFILVFFGLGLLPLATLMVVYPEVTTTFGTVIRWGALGIPTLVVTSAITLISCFGWAGSVIKEKGEMDSAWGQKCLSSAWILFIVSEAAIFFSLFWYYGLQYYDHFDNWPLKGTPHIHLSIPALGTVILFLSSLTCELAHKSLIRKHRTAAKNWLFATMGLGITFLALQGYEWGYLMNLYDFYLSTSIISTLFFMITGFHGIHVMTGLLLLTLAYSRLEYGDMDNKRHFSFTAASWYWHFVDVIWIFVLLGFYVTLQ